MANGRWQGGSGELMADGESEEPTAANGSYYEPSAISYTLLKAALAARRVFSTSAGVWAAERKAASNWDGAK